ncbi:MAG: hypothetical protein IJ867_05685 [Clostridia bacterium]|nr:hypothetical protein [Clostridia bacterium]
MAENKDYFVPEQLDDSDFEKEKIEEKQARKEKKFEWNKKQVVKIISFLLVIALIVVGIYLYLNPIEKKATAPEKAAKDFCAYLNSGNWKKVNQFLDLKGYYILGGVLEEKDYPEFDKAYKSLEDDDSTYAKFEATMNVLMEIDEETLDSLAKIQIRIREIEACNLIQGTESLYKLRINFDYIYDGQTENMTDSIYISNASGEYKMVFGEWMQTVLNYYQSVYMFQSNYGY